MRGILDFVSHGMGVMCLSALIGACTVAPRYQTRPLDPAVLQQRLEARRLDDPDLKAFINEHASGVLAQGGAVWGLDALTLAGLYFHPELNRAHAAWEVRRAEVVTARQRPNPVLNIPFEYHSDTSKDEPEHWTLGLVLDVLFERSAKRRARVAQATALLHEERAHFLSVAWDVRRNIHAHYLALYRVHLRSELLARRAALLEESRDLLKRRVALGEASEFELSSARLQYLRTDLELKELEAEAVRIRAGQASALGLVPDALDGVEFDFSALATLPDAAAFDLKALQYQALTGRSDVVAALADYAQAEAALQLELENRIPDINLSPGYVFDQGDNLWSLGTSLVVPLFHQNQGPIEEANARRRLSASAFEALQADIIGRLSRALEYFRVKCAAVSAAGKLYDDLQRQSRDVQRQFELGYADRLAVLRAQLEVIEVAALRLDAQQGARQAFAELEDAVQWPLNNGIYWQLDPETFEHAAAP